MTETDSVSKKARLKIKNSRFEPIISIFNHSGDISADTPDGRVFTEADWGDTANCKDTFFKSKCLAERAAWDFVARLPGKNYDYCCSSYWFLNMRLRLKMSRT